MADPFIAQIEIFAGNFAPRGWAFCQGQLLPIASNTALFSLIGTFYGGDGRTTFALPDLRGRVPVSAGTGPGLTPRSQGAILGTQSNTLNATQIPSHSHQFTTTMDAAPGTSSTPGAGLVPAEASEDIYGPGTSPVATTRASTSVGSSQSVNNMQPTLVLNFIIALVGTYPSRS